MKIIGTERGKGKTTEAVKIANDTGAYLVVHNQDEVTRLSTKCNRFPITYDELLDGHMKGSFVRNIVIDNIEMFIQRICPGLTIEAITITTTPQKE